MTKIFKNSANIKFGLSEKTDGAMELADHNSNDNSNRRAFFERLSMTGFKIISPKQSHSAVVKEIVAPNLEAADPQADALVTQAAGVVLTITVADCFPVYFYNPVSKAIGLAHSGWRGTVANIVGEVIKKMPGNPGEIIVKIGPGIGPCHFEIQDDISSKFLHYPDAIIHRANKIFIDLPKIIARQLSEAGVHKQNIEVSGECTFCEKEKYFSFRRDNPLKVQALLAYIAMQR